MQALGLEQNLFTSVGALQEEDGATTITADVSGHYYAYVGDTGVNTLKMESEAGSKSFSQVKYHYICDLGWHDAGDVISLTSEDSSSLNVSAYRLNFDVMDEVISILGEQTMTVAVSYTHLDVYKRQTVHGETPFCFAPSQSCRPFPLFRCRSPHPAVFLPRPESLPEFSSLFSSFRYFPDHVIRQSQSSVRAA